MSGDREIGYMSATDLVAAYRRKTLSPVEVTRSALRRLEDRLGQLDGLIVASVKLGNVRASLGCVSPRGGRRR